MTERDNREVDRSREANKTIASLDELPDIDAGPYFFAQVQQRLGHSGSTERLPLWSVFSGLRFAPALLALVVLLNLATAIITLRDDGQTTSEREEYVELLAERYSLFTTTAQISSEGE